MQNTTIQKTQTGTGSSQLSSTRPSKPNTHSTSRPKGKSKYSQKSRANKNKKPVAAKPRGPVFTYTSACCSVPATKKACVAVGKKDALVQGLGRFRCPACKKACKVTVSKFKAAEIVQELKASLSAAMNGIEEQITEVPSAS